MTKLKMKRSGWYCPSRSSTKKKTRETGKYKKKKGRKKKGRKSSVKKLHRR